MNDVVDCYGGLGDVGGQDDFADSLWRFLENHALFFDVDLTVKRMDIVGVGPETVNIVPPVVLVLR